MDEKVIMEYTFDVDCKNPAISRLVRTERPRNYLLKIESFSELLLALTKGNRAVYESLHFDAGDYKWKLSLYPKGDKKRGGDGYISLYLALANPYSLLQCEEVYAFVNFFVYDHRCDNYLVLQDGKEKRFHSLKTEHGFEKLLPLEIFSDPSKGYLVDDCCAFGVEVFLNKIERKGGRVSLTKNNLSSREKSFAWKIDKFSKLSKFKVLSAGGVTRTLFRYPKGYLMRKKTKQDKYDSLCFDAGGHKWKLSLYPNGDNERGGYGYISLYLALADPEPLPEGEEVNAFINFYVYNHLRDNYLVLQDGKEKRFHSLKTECGFEKLLPLDIFNHPSEGYLIGDCCLFGVDVFLNKIEREGGLSLTNRYERYCFTYTLDKFSTFPEMHVSKEFSAGGVKWILQIHPKGDHRAKGRSLGLFLKVHDHSCFSSIYAEYKLSILDQLNKKHHERTVDGYWFNNASNYCDGYGFHEFLNLSDLNDASRGFIVNDTVVVQVTFITISVFVKDMT